MLKRLAGIVGPTEVSLSKTMVSLAEVIGQLRLAAGAFATSNASNANQSLVGLLFGNVATVALAGSVAARAVEVKAVTGLITNSRLVETGTQGFVALSSSAKAALQVADAAAVYGAIVAWGASEFINVADIEQTAQIANQLGNAVPKVEALPGAAESRFRNVDNFAGVIGAI